MPIKEVIFFTYGDSANVATWSNVPYLFSDALIRKGAKVDRVDLTRTPFFDKLRWGGWKIQKLLTPFFPDNAFDYARSNLCMRLTYRLIRQAVRKHSSADLCIFLNFDFYNKFSNIPSLLLSDWTYQILILDHLSRKPYFFEKAFSQWQRTAIEHAKHVVSLFPVCAEMMRRSYPTANIHHIGSNVVNSLYDKPIDIEDFTARRLAGKEILFIGSKQYHEGAQLLIEAVSQLRSHHPDIQLHIIGMTAQDFPRVPGFVHCYGYLHKDKEDERATYYDLITRARLFCNPTRTWGGYSSTIEAMYFGTPVVVSPYKDFVAEFGSEIPFGAYNEAFNADALAATIERVIEAPNYPQLCRQAHERVKDYTWDAYVERLLALVSN